eukprot:4262867-Lingulodinium_polyedra.AAC.1
MEQSLGAVGLDGVWRPVAGVDGMTGRPRIRHQRSAEIRKVVAGTRHQQQRRFAAMQPAPRRQ